MDSRVIYVCVCVCVCVVYVYKCLCMCGYIYLNVYLICINIYVYTHRYICTYVYVCRGVCVCVWVLPFRSQILWFISAHQCVGEKEKKKEKNYLQSLICLCSRKEGNSREIFTNFFSWWVWTLWLHRLAHLAESMWMKRKQPLNSSLRFLLHLAGSAIFRVLFLCTIFFFFLY